MLTLALIVGLMLSGATVLWCLADVKEARAERDAWRMAHETASRRYAALTEAVARERLGRAEAVRRPVEMTAITPGWLAHAAHTESVHLLTARQDVPYVEGPR